MAEFFFLMVVDHHQAIAEAVREATPCDLVRVPPPGGQKFVNRDAELKDTEEAGSRHPEGRVTQSQLL